MPHVFISYGSRDRRIAESLCSYLEDRDIRCWIAPRDISSGNYAGEITRALRAADIVVVLCSKTSSQSEHVKNEVTLAFNNAKPILPYCLDDQPFDDDLEYYLASKQRVPASGDITKDFCLIDKMIREFRNSEPIEDLTIHAYHPHRRWYFATAGIIALLIVGYFLYHNKPKSTPPLDTTPIDTVEVVDSVTLEIIPDTLKTQPPVIQKNENGNTFSGRILSGYPNGFGTYTFRQARRIDMHDSEERTALAGDYIVGDWKDGHLNHGEWFGADGRSKGYILLGDYPDTETDYILGKCGRP